MGICTALFLPPMELGFLGCSGGPSSVQMCSELEPGCSKSVLGAVGGGFGPLRAGDALVFSCLYVPEGDGLQIFLCFSPFCPAKNL